MMDDTKKTNPAGDAKTSGKSPPKKSRFKGQNGGGEKLRYGKKLNTGDKKSAGKLKSSVLSQQLHQKLSQKNEDDNIGTNAVNRSTQIAEGGVAAGRDIGTKAGNFSRKLHSHSLGEEPVSGSAETATGKNSDKLHFTTDDTPGGEPKGASSAKSVGNSTESAGSAAFSKNESTTEKAAGSKSAGRKTGGSGSSNAGDPVSHSNPTSRRIQKRNIQKSYVTGKGGPSGAAGTAGKKTAKEKGKELLQQAGTFIKEHAGLFCVIGVFALIFCLITTQLSSCSSMLSGGTGVVLGSSYTAVDDDILGADEDYSAMEEELREQIGRIEEDYPGYDEYQYSLAEINHNPYVLASYLTVLYEDYSRDEVQSVLQELFDLQYKLTTREEIQIRTRTETRTGHRTVTNEDGTTDTEEYEYEVEVEYEYKILHVTLVNNTLEGIIDTSGLDNVKQERYALLNETLGNRSYLFGDDIYSNPVAAADAPEYNIPGEALSDTRFANMINEAEKYLGYPYVWGGSSPSTSFDCSGFVCWVINHSGNGWNYGRTTAEGLRRQLSIIPASEAKPGDIIFFQGTYNTSGASHVGIYVGNGMMIHCGNPIQYASINTSYWQSHFYCFGRLP